MAVCKIKAVTSVAAFFVSGDYVGEDEKIAFACIWR